VSDAGDFIDAALAREGSWERAQEQQGRLGSGLRFYGASVGAVRGTVRDALRRYSGLTHDEITALSSELWHEAVFERRLAAVVLLQSNVKALRNTDLTRIEGFLREARSQALVDPLAIDVVGPLVEALDPAAASRAESVLDRWAQDQDAWLRRAALLAPLRALRAGRGDWTGFTRRARAALARSPGGATDDVGGDAVSRVLSDVAKSSPGLPLPEFSALARE
jgi:3-methyladenine DNA glycosylase AlkD